LNEDISDEINSYFHNFKNYISDHEFRFTTNFGLSNLSDKESVDNSLINSSNLLRNKLNTIDKFIRALLYENAQLELKYNKILNIQNLNEKSDSINLRDIHFETIKQLKDKILELTKENERIRLKYDESKADRDKFEEKDKLDKVNGGNNNCTNLS